MDDDQLQTTDGAIDPSIIEDTLPEVDAEEFDTELDSDDLDLKDDDDNPDWEKEDDDEF